jgi:hypothetical protein
MELALNLAWVLLSVVLVRLWMSHAPRKGVSRRTQFLALAMLLLILFPVISVTDDLLAAQNPAEIECCMRRDHSAAQPHSIFPAVAALPPSVVAEPALRSLHSVMPCLAQVAAIHCPALSSIQNRPPPAA